jgi:membrane associated rhomboid family serine protease
VAVLVSAQGKKLAALIASGLVIGYVLTLIDPSDFLLAISLQYNGDVLRGAVWQLFTSIIVAPPPIVIQGSLRLEGLMDVGFNAIAVIFLDGLTSGVYSARQYYATFLITALAGNILSLAAGPNQASFGASGGIFGLVAGLVTYDYAVNRRLSVQLVVWFLVIFTYSSISGNVNWLAHAGGALSGFVIGYILGRSKRASGLY